jgi:hypothetical protein
MNVLRQQLRSCSSILISFLSSALRRSTAHGTSRKTAVIRSLATVSIICLGEICSVRRTEQPPASITASRWPMARWYMGGIIRNRSEELKWWLDASVAATHMRLFCRRSTGFGIPVVPEVK